MHSPAKTAGIDLETLDQAGLLKLHAEIERKIVGINLNDVNLSKEALIQLQYAKLLQSDSITGKDDTPMNQRAQVQNSLSGIIDRLAKIQRELFDSEYLKRLKTAVVKCVRTLPKEAQQTFFEILERENTVIENEMNL